MMSELQITQEYLGHSNHLVFLAPMWKEFFQYVAPSSLTGIAGVSNVGSTENWTAHPFAQANWYAFGRLAWNPSLSSEEIAREWIKLTLTSDDISTENTIADIMLSSHEACVDYMMPMGLHHIFAFGHHYGPEPWCYVAGAREDWLPRYYHRADSAGIGFDRSSTGSNAIAQYNKNFSSLVENSDSCPECFLLWFHHVPWTKALQDGTILWDKLCLHYQHGVDEVDNMVSQWKSLEGKIDSEVFDLVSERMDIQAKDARWWRDACILFFQQYSMLEIPSMIQIEHKNLTKLQDINLKISNFEAPNRALLDSVR